MYLRTVNAGGKKYVRVVKSYREGAKVKQEVVANLGALDQIPETTLTSLSNGFKKLSALKRAASEKQEVTLFGTAQNTGAAAVPVNELEGGTVSCYGYLPYKHLWKKFALPEILSDAITAHHDIQFDVSTAVFSMVANRLLTPSSKLHHSQAKDRFTLLEGASDIPLHTYYRTLEYLAERKEEIEERLFEERKHLFNYQQDVLFYDVTTYHFESQQTSDMLNFGFSKAHKVNEVQVVMGLLIDTEGVPVAYELFEGNTLDSKTLPKVLQALEKRFAIRRIILVGDKGINARANLTAIKNAGFDYIVAGRLRSMPRKLQQKILAKDGYQSGGQYAFKVLDYAHTFYDGAKQTVLEEHLICTHSESRARHDASVRRRAAEKAEAALRVGTAGSLLKRQSGYKRFITVKKDDASPAAYELDEERIRKEELFDGYYIIQTSDKSLGAGEVVAQYGYLYKIEESFRLLKTTMKTRPVFHWNTKRIKGHFLVCFIALLLERTLEYLLKTNDVPFTTETIKQSLLDAQFAELITPDKDVFYIKMHQPELASKIFNTLRIKHLPNVLTKSELFAMFA